MSETREEIIAKIKIKRGSTDKLENKTVNLAEQRETYVRSIAEHEEKIAKLRKLIERIDANTSGYSSDAAVRSGEADHMEEILVRYDKAVAERAGISVKIQQAIDKSYEGVEWTPGSGSETYKRDPEFKKLEARRDYLDRVIESALPDVKKIFYSRGTVAEFNEKGRKGV
jgi:uncharacterized small protein (DUF1192 family)